MSRENELTIEVYEKYGDKYLARNMTDLENNPKAKRDNEKQARLLEKYTQGLPPNAPIFEVGAGSGRDAKTLIDLGFRNVMVSDAANFFIRHLSEIGLSPIKFNLITDEFPGKYAVIICWAVLVHFTKPEALAAIRKMHDALNPGGRLLLSVKHKDKHDEGWDDYQNRIGAKRYFTYWDQDVLERALREVGFAQVSIEQQGGARACWLNCCAVK